MNVPDFRAAERTFQLLAQVAGRAGRGSRPGKVLIQTLATDHYAIEAACAQDFEKFVHQEIEFRQTPPYPPFSYVVNIVSADEEMEKAKGRIADSIGDAGDIGDIDPNLEFVSGRQERGNDRRKLRRG